MRIRCKPLLWLSVLVALSFGRALAQGPLQPQVLSRYPCDPELFIQGLESVDNRLIVSSGLYGRSLIGELDLSDGKLINARALDDNLFAEGLTAAGAGIWQITWREGTALLRDRQSLRELKRAAYEGEGWGICHDGRQLYMSDGSASLTLRDPETFEALGRLAVRWQGRTAFRLNELEYAGGFIYANIWLEDTILKIDPANGEAVTAYDLSALRVLALADAAVPDPDAVLNGIAHVREDLFYIGGKRWPLLFLVRLP